MARKQFLQNVHTTKKYSPEVIAAAQLKDGEIAVFQNTEEPSLAIKVGKTYAQFKDSEAVTAEINSAKTELNTTIGQNTTKIGELEAKFKNYATTDALATAKTELTADYDGKFTAIKGEGYTSGTTLKSLSDAIDSLKGGSDTTVGNLATRVTTAERKITALETTVGSSTSGLVKDVADLKTKFDSYATSADTVAADTKTLSDAKSYTDSQINAIKGDSYETGTTLASLKSDIDNQGSAISGITNGDKLNDFRAVENEINSKISSVYRVKGSCTYEELLTKTGQTEGDVWNVTDAHDNVPAGTNYVWAKDEGETTAKWDALGGTIDLSPYATTAITKGLESRLDTAKSNIDTLTTATGTLNTSITTIQGWKINGSAITNSTVLNGDNLKVDATENAKTLKEAIADAAKSGSSANNAFTAWTAGTYSENQAAINTKFSKIDAYTVNGTPISKNPVLTGENVLVGGESANSAKTLNATIAEAKGAGTTAQDNLKTLKGSYSGTLDTLSSKVNTNEQSITQLRTNVDDISPKANSAVQTITVTNTETNGITATKAEGSTNVVLNFDDMVIDCGEF
jgi:hypothetical protein